MHNCDKMKERTKLNIFASNMHIPWHGKLRWKLYEHLFTMNQLWQMTLICIPNTGGCIVLTTGCKNNWSQQQFFTETTSFLWSVNKNLKVSHLVSSPRFSLDGSHILSCCIGMNRPYVTKHGPCIDLESEKLLTNEKQSRSCLPQRSPALSHHPPFPLLH